MRFKTETKMRIQALKYRDGLENHQIAREMGISQTMIWQYVESLEKQIKKGEITVADIVSSCNALKIDGPKKVRKQEVDEILSDQGVTQQQLSENVKALDDAVEKAGEPDMAQGGIVNPINGHEPDGGKEMQTPIKNPAKQSDYVLTIMAHIYDELVAGKVALRYYLMEDGVHELQFVEVKKK